MNNNRWSKEHILSVRQWTDKLWSLRVSRPAGYLFKPGHYARLGLPVEYTEEHPPVWRPYSVVTAPAENELEFLLILIPDGMFTTQLARLGSGDAILVDRNCFGFFLAEQLSPGKTAWMLASGTGLGPYLSMLRDNAVFKRFERIVLVHSVRIEGELAYRDELRVLEKNRPGQFQYLCTITRETQPDALHQRIPELVGNGQLAALAQADFDPAHSRVMVCGNPDFSADMRKMLAAKGFQTGRRGAMGTMLFENYW